MRFEAAGQFPPFLGLLLALVKAKDSVVVEGQGAVGSPDSGSSSGAHGSLRRVS